MKKLSLFAVCVFMGACAGDERISASFTNPGNGALISIDSGFLAGVELSHAVKADSIEYLLDTFKVGKTKLPNGEVAVLSDFHLNTAWLYPGEYVLTAKIYAAGKPIEATAEVTLIPSKKPVPYNYQVVNTYPHDTSSYTQGLEYREGILYESDGEYGGSSLRKVEPRTGKILKKIDLDPKTFSEGITIVGDKLIQLTWEQNKGFVYDKNSFEKLGEFEYGQSRQGWGLCTDGRTIYKSDGTNRIYFLDKDTYRETGSVAVYNNKGPVDNLNELEFIDGRVYANVYGSDHILVINMATGVVEGDIDLSTLLPPGEKPKNDQFVLNGIAWNKQERRLFVTGKKWPKLFELEIMPSAIFGKN